MGTLSKVRFKQVSAETGFPVLRRNTVQVFLPSDSKILKNNSVIEEQKTRVVVLDKVVGILMMLITFSMITQMSRSLCDNNGRKDSHF